MKTYSMLLLSLALTACGDGGSSPTSPPPLPPKELASKALIEKSLGANLEKPVFQCGSGTDTLTADAAPDSVADFESGPVRPIALSADGKRLFVTNTPAHCLEIYAVNGDSLTLAATLSVGLEPVAVAERNADEVWVVNHMSDSISIVRLDGTPRVLRTLQVGDEPRDIVFAGPNRDRAFITAAARGQNKPGFSVDYLTQAGVGRGDVWVFDASALDDSLNGNPLAIITLPAEVPRALAVTPDGATVYAAVFNSGNGTTTLHRDALKTGSGNATVKPASPTSANGTAAPLTSLIVRYKGGKWVDETGQNLSAKVKFSLPDEDVFAIDANASVPAFDKQAGKRFSGAGTTLFNMAVHPTDGRLFVSNTDAVNEVRFEGSGDKSRGSTVSGRIAESRISVINPASKTVVPVHLNKHLNFAQTGVNVPVEHKARSLAQPTAMVASPDGKVIYTAAFGSGKVAAIPTSGLTASFQPDAESHIDVAKGPSGLALNANGSRLYVYSRIEQKISVIDTTSRAVLVTSIAMFNPEADVVQKGRQFLYDAKETSANGSVSCASCHVFGDMDHLAWDLGNPDENEVANKNKYVQSTVDQNRLFPSIVKINASFHPVKGPMSTQTLRGMKGNGPLHWRGDRMGASPAQVAGKAEMLEDAAFKEFNDSFVSLLGRKEALTAEQLQQYTRFAMQMVLPPNPVRALDGSLDANQAAGKKIYNEVNSITGLGSCNNCHTLDPAAGKFGTAGLLSFEGPRFTDNFKVPHLRNMYQKVGMFGNSVDTVSSPTGAQVRGFGFGHDGSLDTLDSFFKDPVFVFPAPVDVTRKQVVSFVLAFDTDYAPIVGQQVSWRPGASDAVDARLALLQQQALVTTPRPACDLQARGNSDGKAFSALMQADGSWAMRGGGSKTDSALRAMATASTPITFTCLPPRTGKRTALDSL